MRQVMQIAIGTFVGVIIGAMLVTHWMGDPRAAEELTLRSLKLTNAAGQVVAHLGTNQGETKLEVLDPGTKAVAIELGVRGDGRFLRFWSPEGKHVASIQSLPPSSATTLYLGDTLLETRVILGALRGDMDHAASPSDTIENWVLQIRDPLRRDSVVQLLARPYSPSGEYGGSIRLRDPTRAE